jgi:hypothetical protein
VRGLSPNGLEVGRMKSYGSGLVVVGADVLFVSSS